LSEQVFKAGVRWKIDGLKDAPLDEVVKFFRIFNLEPDDVDDDWIYYPHKMGTLCPRYEYNDKNEREWYLEYIVVYDKDYEFTPFILRGIDIFSMTDEIQIRIAENEQYHHSSFLFPKPVVFAYSWYNGVDEPFEEPQKYKSIL
jgi:hypothetical protein